MPIICPAPLLDFIFFQPGMFLDSANEIVQRGRLFHDKVIVERGIIDEPVSEGGYCNLGLVTFNFIVEVLVPLGIISQ